MIVADVSGSDINVAGARGLVPGWPGAAIAPAQPMVSQMRHVLQRYKDRGGHVRQVQVPDAGHACHLEQEDLFVRELRQFLKP